MKMSYIETYENEDGNIVLVYVKDAEAYSQAETGTIVISCDDVKNICKALKDTLSQIEG